jgi:hypothetical protein
MTRETKRRARARRPLPPVYELAAFSVFGFCLAHGLSRSKFYGMLREGEGPRVMKCGTRTLISVEAARAWRQARERTATSAASVRRSARCPSRKLLHDRLDDRRSARARRHRVRAL